MFIFQGVAGSTPPLWDAPQHPPLTWSPISSQPCGLHQSLILSPPCQGSSTSPYTLSPPSPWPVLSLLLWHPSASKSTCISQHPQCKPGPLADGPYKERGCRFIIVTENPWSQSLILSLPFEPDQLHNRWLFRRCRGNQRGILSVFLC